MYSSVKSSSAYQGLYVVATPIGNLSDISLRAIEVLQNCDLVLCEDTRVSGKLMVSQNIKTTLMAYHDHNGEKLRPEIMERLENGQAIALISDAGTPLISDPGYKLVQMAHESGIKVTPVPGASAFLAGLSASGLPTDKFIFLGFLPPKKNQAEKILQDYLPLKATQIYYETAPRIEKTLNILNMICPDRVLAIARELTKLHEEIIRGTADEILAEIKARQAPLKGEIVLLIAPADVSECINDEELTEVLLKTLKTESVSMAVKSVSNRLNLPRNRVYDLALKLSKS